MQPKITIDYDTTDDACFVTYRVTPTDSVVPLEDFLRSIKNIRTKIPAWAAVLDTDCATIMGGPFALHSQEVSLNRGFSLDVTFTAPMDVAKHEDDLEKVMSAYAKYYKNV